MMITVMMMRIMMVTMVLVAADVDDEDFVR